MNFRGQPGPKTPIVLPKHKENSGKTRKKLAQAKKRPPVEVVLDWYAR